MKFWELACFVFLAVAHRVCDHGICKLLSPKLEGNDHCLKWMIMVLKGMVVVINFYLKIKSLKLVMQVTFYFMKILKSLCFNLKWFWCKR
jgi:hypothetical protein